MAVTRGAALLVLAGGRGVRAGGPTPKQFVTDRRGCSVLARCLMGARAAGDWGRIVVVAPESDVTTAEEHLRVAGLTGATVVPGGEHRLDSLLDGLAQLDPVASPLCVIHDGTRPFTPSALFRDVLDAVSRDGVDAAWPAAAPASAVLTVAEPVPRALRSQDLLIVSTPIAVRTEVVRRIVTGQSDSDSAVVPLLIRGGARWVSVPDSPLNFKVTTPADLRDTVALMDAEARPVGGPS